MKSKTFSPKISIMSPLPKIFYAILAHKLKHVLDGRISNLQHGLITSLSTQSNLSLFNHHISQSLNKGTRMDVNSIDFSKAFDLVDHGLLIV